MGILASCSHSTDIRCLDKLGYGEHIQLAKPTPQLASSLFGVRVPRASRVRLCVKRARAMQSIRLAGGRKFPRCGRFYDEVDTMTYMEQAMQPKLSDLMTRY